MDPTAVFCPNLACPARGQAGEGNIRIHARTDKRFICTECHKTFSATKQTSPRFPRHLWGVQRILPAHHPLSNSPSLVPQ